MALQGKGYFIWKIKDCENGNAKAIAGKAQAAGFTHVALKIADGVNSYNVDTFTGLDLAPPVVQALCANGIKVYGWHYVYGYDPAGEANKAIQRIQDLHLDGYVIDAEAEYKQPGRDAAARQFMSALRKSLPNFPIALSSYRYPSYHPQIPWKEFLEKCDYNMPQVYWMQNHNPGEQLTRSVQEFESLAPYRPIIPTGAAFRQNNWQPTVDDILEFLNTARSLNLNGVNFWEWANSCSYVPDAWEAIKAYSWSDEPLPKDIAQQYIDALNSRDPSQVLALYNPAAVHVTPARTLQGLDAIRTWYSAFFSQTLPNAVFTLTSFSGSGASRHLAWTAASTNGKVQNGNDTLGLVNGKITYHYTFFTVS